MILKKTLAIPKYFGRSFTSDRCLNQRLQTWEGQGKYLFGMKQKVRYITGLVQYCSSSIANTLELLQSCTKPLISIMVGDSNPFVSSDMQTMLSDTM